jgi:hypothetical protein
VALRPAYLAFARVLNWLALLARVSCEVTPAGFFPLTERIRVGPFGTGHGGRRLDRRVRVGVGRGGGQPAGTSRGARVAGRRRPGLFEARPAGGTRSGWPFSWPARQAVVTAAGGDRPSVGVAEQLPSGGAPLLGVLVQVGHQRRGHRLPTHGPALLAESNVGDHVIPQGLRSGNSPGLVRCGQPSWWSWWPWGRRALVSCGVDSWLHSSRVGGCC